MSELFFELVDELFAELDDFVLDLLSDFVEELFVLTLLSVLLSVAALLVEPDTELSELTFSEEPDFSSASEVFESAFEVEDFSPEDSEPDSAEP